MTTQLTKLQRIRYRWDVRGETQGHAATSEDAIDRLTAFRKRQLATSVRIVPEVMPGVAEACSRAIHRLGMDLLLDAYVVNSCEPQAFCVSCGQEHLPVICLSAGMVDLLSYAELEFVIGHEVGHYVMGHRGDALDPARLEGPESVNALACQRASEISADRVGLLACGGSKEAARAILKTATGLAERHLRFDLAVYLDQARELASIGGAPSEMFATHPMFAVRLRALLWFEMSNLWSEFCARQSDVALTTEQLDARIERDLEKVSGFSMADHSEAHLRTAAVWAIACSFAEDGVLSRDEQDALKALFGEQTAMDVIGFIGNCGLADARKKMSDALSRIRTFPTDLRERWMHEITQASSASLSNGVSEGSLSTLRSIIGL